MNWLQIYHTTTRDSGRRSYPQIIYFEHHGASFWHFNTLTIVQTQHLIIVKHSVHVFNPKSVDRTIEADPSLPFSFFCFKSLYSFFYKMRNNTFCPFIRELVDFTIKFTHSYSLRVKLRDLHISVPCISFLVWLSERGESFTKDESYSWFSSTSRSYQHVSMTNSHCFK